MMTYVHCVIRCEECGASISVHRVDRIEQYVFGFGGSMARVVRMQHLEGHDEPEWSVAQKPYADAVFLCSDCCSRVKGDYAYVAPLSQARL